MDIFDQVSFPVLLTGYPVTGFPQLSSLFATFSQEQAALSSMAADSIIPGTSQAAIYNQDLVKEIQDQESLIATLASLAASTPGASGWVTSDINYLQGLIQQEETRLTQDGGSLSGSAGASTGGDGIPKHFVIADMVNPSSIGASSTTGSTANQGLGGQVAISSGLSPTDSAALRILATSPWGPTTSAADLVALMSILGHDSPNSVLGEDALAALELAKASQNPQVAIARLVSDGGNPNVTSSTTTLSGISAPDRANILLAETYYAAQDWGDLAKIFPLLEGSSNQFVAGIASAELTIWDGAAGPSALGAGVSALGDYLAGESIPSGTMSIMIEELSNATNRTVSWTGSGFTYSSIVISVDTGALNSAVESAMAVANKSIHITKTGSPNEAELNAEASAVVNAILNFQENPNLQTGQALESAQVKYVHDLAYDNASSASIVAVEDAVDKAIDTTSYGKLTFDNHDSTVSGDIGYAVGYAIVMDTWGSLMTPSQIGQSDTVSFGVPEKGATADTASHFTVAAPLGNSDAWTAIAGHETMWDMESSQYAAAVVSQYGYAPYNNGVWDANAPAWILTEDVLDFLQALLTRPGFAPAGVTGSSLVSWTGSSFVISSSGQFTVNDLESAFLSGNQQAEQKIFTALFPPRGSSTGPSYGNFPKR